MHTKGTPDKVNLLNNLRRVHSQLFNLATIYNSDLCSRVQSNGAQHSFELIRPEME